MIIPLTTSNMPIDAAHEDNDPDYMILKIVAIHVNLFVAWLSLREVHNPFSSFGNINSALRSLPVALPPPGQPLIGFLVRPRPPF